MRISSRGAEVWQRRERWLGSDFVVFQIGYFHERSQQSDLERMRSVYGDYNPLATTILQEDVVTSLDTRELPSAPLNGLRKLLASDLLQTASSRTRSSGLGLFTS